MTDKLSERFIRRADQLRIQGTRKAARIDLSHIYLDQSQVAQLVESLVPRIEALESRVPTTVVSWHHQTRRFTPQPEAAPKFSVGDNVRLKGELEGGRTITGILEGNVIFYELTDSDGCKSIWPESCLELVPAEPPCPFKVGDRVRLKKFPEEGLRTIESIERTSGDDREFGHYLIRVFDHNGIRGFDYESSYELAPAPDEPSCPFKPRDRVRHTVSGRIGIVAGRHQDPHLLAVHCGDSYAHHWLIAECELVAATDEPPCLFKAGDRVRQTRHPDQGPRTVTSTEWCNGCWRIHGKTDSGGITNGWESDYELDTMLVWTEPANTKGLWVTKCGGYMIVIRLILDGSEGGYARWTRHANGMWSYDSTPPDLEAAQLACQQHADAKERTPLCASA